MDIEGLITPALILDRRRLLSNAALMRDRAGRLGVTLRPHMKTAKSPEIGRIALGCDVGDADGTGPVTVSTLREADYFRGHGFNDILYAVAIAPGKLDQAAGMMSWGLDLKIVTDTVQGARAIAAHGSPFQVLIEIDCGDHRGGVADGDAALLEIAAAVEDGGKAKICGVMTHAGQSYDCRTPESMAEVAEIERRAAVDAADRLREAGFSCSIVSVGSTPTATFARDLSGVTEIRPGVYMFSDLFQAAIGTSRIDDLAVSVLASVIGRREGDNMALIDAGGLALSKDRSGAVLDDDPGYGLVCDPLTCRPIGDLRISAVSQEHGRVTSPSGTPLTLEIGSKVRILPNHACMTSAAYEAYHVVDGGDEIIARWRRCNGW
ncbi:alanine racemase [Varunaivibrio sulfuroxidans]|uniref:D-serine deaminase-like pyridoxal phosphate-dependent protein n=1 Tax=Varunaivibrio sulfuroxidans TaxID=1773489 RepID=A0A4R3JIY6_9PROT|nr:alanine racemase [Varunaivibrio sulfuroxidans]TCS64790.1 D-serine deaminase-like pyridoxal phosphate-dependent protein [Varunaivibrio sulfuroxidans]WES29906.1 alanine racemase [Varunaivibrio sulfuroxidans]